MTSMVPLNAQKLSRLLDSYVEELAQLEVVVAGLDAAGLTTVRLKKIAAARVLAKGHLLALETDAFGDKQETALIRHLEDARMPAFDLETAFENAKGFAVQRFNACEKAWNELNDFVFAEEGPVNE